MSYILDALRRADAQRERDPSRGIHAQPAVLLPDDPRWRARPVLPWMVLGLALVLIAGAGWLWWSAGAAQPTTVAAVQPAPSAVPVTPVAPQPQPAIPPAAAPGEAPATAVLPPPPPVQRRVQPVPPSPAAPAAAPPAATAPVPAPAPVPADGGGLPKMAITGGVYANTASQRMLIVNGQVFNEGAEPVPGVVLEQIRPNAAVLRFRGQRYTVPY